MWVRFTYCNPELGKGSWCYSNSNELIRVYHDHTLDQVIRHEVKAGWCVFKGPGTKGLVIMHPREVGTTISVDDCVTLEPIKLVELSEDNPNGIH